MPWQDDGTEFFKRHGGDDPDTLPASITAGEKRVLAALARLPDECLV